MYSTRLVSTTLAIHLGFSIKKKTLAPGHVVGTCDAGICDLPGAAHQPWPFFAPGFESKPQQFVIAFLLCKVSKYFEISKSVAFPVKPVDFFLRGLWSLNARTVAYGKHFLRLVWSCEKPFSNLIGFLFGPWISVLHLIGIEAKLQVP